MENNDVLCNDYQLLSSGPLTDDKCSELLNKLINSVKWQQDHHVAFNRRFAIPRLQAWYADEGIQYSYANNLLKTQPWIKPLKAIQQRIQAITHCTFNSVLVTYYRNGQDSVGWHADDEVELGAEPVIASLSLGATRIFEFRHKQQQIQGDIPLKNGDVLVMKPNFQKQWQHRVPEDPDVKEPRINLTFRNVVNRR